MQKVKRFDPFAIISVLFFVFIVYFTQLGLNGIASNLFLLTFPFVVLVFFVKIYSANIPRDYHIIIISTLILSGLNVLMNGMSLDASDSGSFDYYKKVIMFNMTLIWIVCCTFTFISRATVWVELILVALINIIFIIYYQQGFNIEFGTTLLTLNFTNSNFAGVVMVTTLLYILLPIFGGKDLGLKGFGRIVFLAVLILIAITIFGIFILTGCRGAFGTLTLFILLVVIDRIPRLNFRLKKWMIACIVAFPFVFALLYVAYINTLDIDMSFGMQAGKNNDSRMTIWQPIVSNFFHYVLIGDYSGISYGTGLSQMHNTHLDIFASYGFLPLLLYMLLLYKAIVRVQKNIYCRFQRLSLYAFVSCFVFMTFEACFVAGSMGLYLLVGGFLMLANYQLPNKKLSEKTR